MTSRSFHSVRMRASSGNTHVSGSERLVPERMVRSTVADLYDRAMSKAVRPDSIVITIDDLNGLPVRTLRALDLTACTSRDRDVCRRTAKEHLRNWAVSEQAVSEAFRMLDGDASASGGAMRGGMVMDAANGSRLEPDRERGVRVSRFDWSEEAAPTVIAVLDRLGLSHFRTREALALATKVAHAPGVIAELCWSDDPDYQAGYVASLAGGYVRLPVMKEEGVPTGGRVFFVRPEARSEMASLLSYLEREPVLISGPRRCSMQEAPGVR